MKDNTINSFAETVPPAKTEPKKPVKYEEHNTTDPEDKRKLKNTIIKWVIAILILGLIAVMFYFACAPTSKFVRVSNSKYETSVGTTKGTLVLEDGNEKYVVDLAKNGGAEAYYSGPDFMTYIFYADSNRGQISFQVKIYNTADDVHYAMIGNVRYFLDGDETLATEQPLIDWIFYASNNAAIPNNSTSWWIILLQMLPTLIFFIFIIWSFSRLSKMQGGMGGEDSVFGMGKSQAKITTSTVKFDDVAGIEEEKAELIEIVDYLKNPEKYAAMGARTPRGVILYGPPGTGKTLLAKAVAGEAKVPFFQVSGSAFEDMLVGVGAKRVRDLFLKAKKAAPSIIFIDEIDSVASKRGKMDVGGSSGLADQTINQLLSEMDGFNNRTGVVVMAATNRLDVLDDAILRPGRFDRHIQVNLPDIKERVAILKIHSKNKNLSSKVILEDVARRTPGFSGAQLENVLNEATLLAVRVNKSSITMEEIDEAIDRVIAGPAKRSRVITEPEKKQIAYHEAGHALVGLHTQGSDVVEKITIIPRGYAAGYTLSTPEKQELSIQKKSDLLGLIASTLGGRASEELVYGPEEISTGASNDLYKVTNVVRAMVMQLGMSDVGMTQFIPSEGPATHGQIKLYSESTALDIDKAIEKIIVTQFNYAKTVISKNRQELDLIVEALLLLETIVKKQIDYIHKYLKLPEEAQTKKDELMARKNADNDLNQFKSELVKTENDAAAAAVKKTKSKLKIKKLEK